ncbi:MAG: metallophosphoesterase family protein [Candidatus Omnitrophota bacterium]
MKVGVISDTHIPFAANDLPKSIYENFKGVELILHAGDLAEMSVLEKLKKICKTVAVRGNMDSHAVKKALAQKEIIKVRNFTLGLIHGEGPPSGICDLVREAFRGEKVDAIVFGHSHSPLCETHNGILYFNPGSPTDKIFSSFNSYGILEINDKIEGRIIRL